MAIATTTFFSFVLGDLVFSFFLNGRHSSPLKVDRIAEGAEKVKDVYRDKNNFINWQTHFDPFLHEGGYSFEIGRAL